MENFMFYPPNWPRCPVCGDYALDGHITCGRYECNEGEQRDRRAEEYRQRLIQKWRAKNTADD